jgi:hypothetical protein
VARPKTAPEVILTGHRLKGKIFPGVLPAIDRTMILVSLETGAGERRAPIARLRSYRG